MSVRTEDDGKSGYQSWTAIAEIEVSGNGTGGGYFGYVELRGWGATEAEALTNLSAALGELAWRAWAEREHNGR